MVPNVVRKALLLALISLCIQINLASLVCGFTCKGYAKTWWWQPMRTTLLKYDQQHRVPQHMMNEWEGEGRAFRGTLRPARAVRFAPASKSR